MKTVILLFVANLVALAFVGLAAYCIFNGHFGWGFVYALIGLGCTHSYTTK